MTIFFKGESIKVHLLPTAPESVIFHLEKFMVDLKAVFSKPVVTSSLKDAEVVIGTVEQLEKASLYEHVSSASLYDEHGKLRWEADLLQVVGKKLFITGSDARGVIYGMYELSKRVGVSPWYYFADVAIKKRANFELPANFLVSDYPSVQYRGIFINDEEELNNWAKFHTPDGTIGPTAYEKIFELLLRLKANYIWPAMHVNYFNGNPENSRLANEMGIVVGTSHCDMLLRSNQNEWVPWLEENGYRTSDVQYDYSIPGENREILKAYWQGSVENNRNYEVSYTVGMRGIHDSGFVTKLIEEDESLSVSEKFAQKKALLEQVINDQRTILSQTLCRPANQILQTFVPYKEVLPYYDEGLKVPEDVTIIWANDNYGYVRRYPSLIDQKRSGGHGLYYHSSYWAATNMHYLFISSTPLARMKNELQKAWDNGIQKLWVLNVGALKPIEQDLEFFTRFAFEIGKEKTTQDIEMFLSQWIDDNFSGEIGRMVGPLLNAFTQITNVRKIEQLDPGTFSQLYFGDEGARRINELKIVYDKVNKIADTLPKKERAAYFELVQMKIHAAYYKNCEFYFADRSVIATKQGKCQAADEYVRRSAEFTNFLRWMVYYYNKIMADGKWDKILTPELAPPPNMKMYPTTKPALKIGAAELGVILWQDSKKSTSLIVESGISRATWFEIFNYGAGSIPYEITAPDWVHLSKSLGDVRTEERIFVEVEGGEANRNGEIVIHSLGRPDKVIPVNLVAPIALSAEKNGVIVLAASCFDENSSTQEGTFKVIDYLGRGGGAALEAYAPKMISLSAKDKTLPSVTYIFNLTTAGSHLLELFRLPTLNSIGQIRIGVSVDNGEIEIVKTETTDEYRGKWAQAVLVEVDKMYVHLPFLTAGNHKLKLWMIDSYVTISKLVVYTKGFVQTSLGPITGKKASEEIPLNLDLLETCEHCYHSTFSVVEPPEIIFADESYYQQNILSGNLIHQPQKNMISSVNPIRSDGTKDVIADFLTKQQIYSVNGRISFEVECALAQNDTAYTVSALPDAHPGEFEYIGTPTNGGHGLGLYLNNHPGVLWPEAQCAPSLNYQLDVTEPGKYYVWVLLKYDDKGKDSLQIGANSEWLPMHEQYNQGHLFSYRNISLWHWNCRGIVELRKGDNLFSIAGYTAGVKIDRVFLSQTITLPPLDEEWTNTWK